MVGAHTRGGKSYHLSDSRKNSAKLSKILRTGRTRRNRSPPEETQITVRRNNPDNSRVIRESPQNSRSEARRDQIPYQIVRSSRISKKTINNQGILSPLLENHKFWISKRSEIHRPFLDNFLRPLDKPFDNAPLVLLLDLEPCGHVNDFNNFFHKIAHQNNLIIFSCVTSSQNPPVDQALEHWHP